MEPITLLVIGVWMVPCILAQIIEGLRILQDGAISLSKSQKIIQLSVHQPFGDMMTPESCLEILPSNDMVSWHHGMIVIPRHSSGSMKLPSHKSCLGVIRTSTSEQRKLKLNHAEPDIRVERVFNFGENVG